MMIAKKCNTSLYNLINSSFFLKPCPNVNSTNCTSLPGKNHLRPKNKSFPIQNMKINSFIVKINLSLLLNPRYSFSKVVESQPKDKQILEFLEDIVAQTKINCKINGQYTLLYLISQARQIHPKLQSSEIEDLAILSKNILYKTQQVQQTNQGETSETSSDLITQLSCWLLLRIYVSSVAFSRVCLKIYSLDRIHANQNIEDEKPLKHSEKVKEEVFNQMENSLAEFDSFKLKYRDSEVHKKLQKYIAEGLEEFSLCRKKNITREERQKMRANPKELKLEQFEKSEEHFLHQMAKLREAILTSNFGKVNGMYLTNSLLIIMSNQKFKQSQSNYLLNSILRLSELSSQSAISFEEKISRLKQFKLTESPHVKQKRLLIRNIDEVMPEIKFMVEKLVQVNRGLKANELPPVRKFIAKFLNALFYFAVTLVGLVYAVVTVRQWFDNLFNKKHVQK